MPLATFALGALLHWLVEAWPPLEVWTLQKPGALGQLGRWIALLLAATVIAILVCLSLMSRYSWIGRAQSVDFLNVDFLTARDRLLPLLAGVFGWLTHRHRERLAEFTRSLLIEPATHGQTGRHPVEARAWLRSAGGLPIFGAMILIGLVVYFYDDPRWRLQSFKLGGVEAQFAAERNRIDLGGTLRPENWPENRNVLATVDELKEFAKNFLPEGSKELIFLNKFAIPLADATRCYAKEFPARETDIRRQYTIVAIGWMHISRKVLLKDIPLDVKEVEELFGKSDKLIMGMRDEINNVATYKPECKAIAGMDGRDSDKLAASGLSQDLPQLFSNGYIISSIASFIDIVYDHKQVILYMNDMGQRIGNNNSADMYFYLTRAKAMYISRWYSRQDARDDLGRAREIADRIGPTKSPFFDAYRAHIVNWQLYFPIRDWLEGHLLVRDEIPRLQIWAKELRDLLKQDWTNQPNVGWNVAAERDFLIPAVLDTLGMSELAFGISTNNLSRERCDQAAVDFSIAKERLLKLPSAEYQDPLKISEAHRELRDALCVSETSR